MRNIFCILSLFVFSSCGSQDLADRDNRNDDHHDDHRHDHDRYDDDRDDRRPWWSP
jgi:hypothetical protein